MSLIASKEFGCENAWIMPKNVPQEDTGDRIRRLKKALGYDTTTAFAKKIGVSLARLNGVENGNPLGRDLANRLVQAVPGLTTDWLWYGVEGGLSVALARLLDEVDTKAG